MPARKYRTLTVAVALASVGALVLAAFVFRQGIVERWHLWRLEEGDAREKELAAEKLAELRSVRAIPRLVRLLPSEAPPQSELTHYALRALAGIGEPAMEALVEGLRSEEKDLQWRSLHALTAVGEPAVPSLTRALGNEDERLRRLAAYILGLLGSDARAAEPVLTGALQREDEPGRTVLRRALERIRGDGS